MWLPAAPWYVHVCSEFGNTHLGHICEPSDALTGQPLPSPPGHWYRCIEEDEAGLLDLEQMPHFGKGLDLRKASEESFEVKDVYNPTLDSEAIKQTLYRQAKNQVGVPWDFSLAALQQFYRIS